MKTHASPTALIAEDEPLLARSLQADLARAWPELQIVATVGDGASAVAQTLQLRPDALFFDIRMPGMSGLEAAAELAEQWDESTPFPALVFVKAFETQAVDYLLKPVQAARLQKTVTSLQARLAQRSAGRTGLDEALGQLRDLMSSAASSATDSGSTALLRQIQASVGNQIRMVPIDEVVYFEAADKYIRVLTADHEYLIRTPLKDLLPQLDATVFWQVHRGTVVQAGEIESVTRDEAGKLWLQMRKRSERLAVSRLYAAQFRAM